MTAFRAAYRKLVKAEAAYNAAPLGTPQSEDVWLETAARDAYSAVIRAPIASAVDAVAALRFCAENPDDFVVPKILERCIAHMAVADRRAA